MPLPTDVKYFHSRMTGLSPIPTSVSSSSYRDLVFNRCLTTGANQRTAESVVINSGTVTVTCQSHGYELWTVIRMWGSNIDELNVSTGHRVIAVTANTFQFEIEGVADQTATGTIFVRLEHAGYSTLYVSGGAIMYGFPGHPTMGVNFANASTYFARSYMFEFPTGYSTGTNEIGNASLGMWGGYSNGEYASDWMLVCDHSTVYLFWEIYAYQLNSVFRTMSVWGKINSFWENDDNAWILSASKSPPYSTNNTSSTDHMCSSGILECEYGDGYAKILRALDGTYNQTIYSAGQTNRFPGGPSRNWEYEGANPGAPSPAFPSAVDNGMVLTDWLIREIGFNYPLRGKLRGAYWPIVDRPYNWQLPPTIIDGVAGLASRKIVIGAIQRPRNRIVDQMINGNGSLASRIAIDIIGPWD